MISGLSFRPRPIDVNKHIPIIRKEIEGEDVELTGVISRSLPLMPTGMEAEDEEEAHIQEAIKQSLNGIQPDKVAIPTPDIKIVPGYDDAPNPTPFVRPQAYLRTKDLTHEEWLQKVEYDLDPEDTEFISQLNANKKIVSENKFEFIIDRCEKEAARMGCKVPSCSAMEGILSHLRPNVVQIVYSYWVKKRERNGNVPLIADLIEPPDPEDPNPYKPFRKRTEEMKQAQRGRRKNDLPALMKMKQLRHEMEKSRTLLEMIKKREKMKRDHVEVICQIFDARCEMIRQWEAEGPLPVGSSEKKKKAKAPRSLFPESPPELGYSPKKKKARTDDPYAVFDFEREVSEMESEAEAASVSSDGEYSPSEDSPPASPRAERRREEGSASAAQHPVGSRATHQKLLESGIISHIPKMAPFRGRVRIGRGGRILFDRTSGHGRSSGVVPFWESDHESNERLNSLADLHRSGFHPLMCGRTDAEKLLKKLEQQEAQMKRNPE